MRGLFGRDLISRFFRHLAWLCPLLAASLTLHSPVSAKQPDVRIRTQGELSFGTFMVFGSGSRRVSSSGIVSDNSVVSLEGITPQPARFSVEYDRGNNSRNPLDILIEVVITTPGRQRFGGVEAGIARLFTDLPGHRRVSSGESMQVRLRNCRARVCTQSFNVGGLLRVNRLYGGAKVDIPLAIDARVVSVDRE